MEKVLADWTVQTSVFNVLYLRLDSLVFFSAINPILYNALSTKFRKSFRRTLGCGEAAMNSNNRAPSMTYLANTRLSTVSALQNYQHRLSNVSLQTNASNRLR